MFENYLLISKITPQTLVDTCFLCNRPYGWLFIGSNKFGTVKDLFASNQIFFAWPIQRTNINFQCTVNGIDYQPTIASETKKIAKSNAAALALQELGLMAKDPNNPLWMSCSRQICINFCSVRKQMNLCPRLFSSEKYKHKKAVSLSNAIHWSMGQEW